MRVWTTEARRRQSQLIQRWEPWKQSTGAKTAEGKAASKMNAFKHGNRSAEVRAAYKVITEHKRILCQIIKR